MSSLDLQYIAELVPHAQEGDSNAFAELFAATYQRQYAFAFAYLRDEFLAQQALTQAYTQALKHLSSLRDPSLFILWLNQWMLRACLTLEAAGVPAGQAHEHHQLDLDGVPCSVRQILTLPLSEAQTLLLSRLCGMKPRAIAALLEIRKSDVRRHMLSGLRRIKTLYGKKEGEAS